MAARAAAAAGFTKGSLSKANTGRDATTAMAAMADVGRSCLRSTAASRQTAAMAARAFREKLRLLNLLICLSVIVSRSKLVKVAMAAAAVKGYEKGNIGVAVSRWICAFRSRVCGQGRQIVLSGQAEAGHASRLDSLPVAMDLKNLSVHGGGDFRIDEGCHPTKNDIDSESAYRIDLLQSGR